MISKKIGIVESIVDQNGELDDISRKSLENELLEIQESLEKTIIFTTHYTEEAMKLGILTIYDEEEHE